MQGHKYCVSYERQIQEVKEQAVCESTTLVDASAMPFILRAIIELAVDEKGQFADYDLGNGRMILLHPAEKNGFDLEVGDAVTIELTACGQSADPVIPAEPEITQMHTICELATIACYYRNVAKYFEINAEKIEIDKY